MLKKSKILVNYSVEFEQEIEVELPENLSDGDYEYEVGDVYENQEFFSEFDNILKNNDKVFRNFDRLDGKMIGSNYNYFKITKI